MQDKKTQFELKRLLDLQSKARHDWIFGGFSTAEQIEYDKGKTRIHDLETELQASAGASTVGNDRSGRPTTRVEQDLRSRYPSGGG